ncbi:MAG TPA: pyruvate oxidase [Bacillales bacterium]|nr:pyruvate oxidase [Bacillales bacterium]
MFTKKAGELAVDLLLDWGIDHIYGLPGDSINHLVEQLRKDKNRIDFVQVRHEETAALAAASYAKLTGKIGVCLSIAGPGAIHLLNGLYDAKEDGAPVLVLAGQVPSEQLGTGHFQEIHLTRMFEDVAVFNEQVASEEQLTSLLNQAIRTAYAKKGVSVLSIPDDILAKKVKDQVQENAVLIAEPEITPAEKDLSQALELLSGSEKPVILAGKGAKGAKKELESFAEKAGAPVIVSLPGKGVIADEHPHCLGNLGLIGTKPAYQAMQEADLLILIGTSFPYTEFFPDNARCIQIDIDPAEIGKRYKVNVGLAGDAKTSLHWLNEKMERREDRTFLQTSKENMDLWWEELKEIEQESGEPMTAQQVIPVLQEVVDSDAVLSVDVGNVTVWMTRYFKMTTDQDFLISSTLGTMGCALPGAIAAKMACPDRQVVGVSGDGGFSMVMQDFLTAVRYKLPILFVVLNNEKIGMIKYEQQQIGSVEYLTDLESFDFAQFAEICGGKGFRVEKFDDLKPAFEKAKASNAPVIVDVLIEDQPPLPGKIPYEQIVSYSKHILKKLFEEGELDLPPVKRALKRL